MTKEQKRAAAVEHLLTLLECLEPKRRKQTNREHRIPLTSFQGIIPMTERIVDGDRWNLFELFDDGEEKYFSPEGEWAVTPEVIWPVDICVLSAAVEQYLSGEHVPDERVLQRYRSVGLKEMRGRRVLSPYNLQALYGLLNFESGVYESAKGHYSWNGRIWAASGDFDGIKSMSPAMQRADDLPIKMAFSIALVCDYTWQVWLGYDGGPTLSFLTDPVGVRAAFRLRDVPEGKSRRAALRHWVTDHWRQRRDDPTEKSYVVKHLRGKETFHWSGLACTVVPSPSDLREAKRAKDNRAEVLRYHQGF